MGAEEDRLAAALTAGMADPQRMKLHYDGEITDTNFSATPKLVSVILDFGSGTVAVPMPYRLSYGGGVAPQVGDIVQVEVANFKHTVIDKLAT